MSGAERVRVRLNGDDREVPAGSLLELLVALGRDPRVVAIERNGEIVPRAAYAAVTLRENDRLEIVGFVQGG